MVLDPCALSGSTMSSNFTSNTHHPGCLLNTASPRRCFIIPCVQSNSPRLTHIACNSLRHKRAACLTSRCTNQVAQRRTHLRLKCLGNAQQAGAGVVSESNMEVIDAVDVEALQLPPTESLAGGLHLKNHEIERLSLDLKSQMLDLEVLTVSLAPAYDSRANHTTARRLAQFPIE